MKRIKHLLVAAVLLANIGVTSGAQIAAAEVTVENDSNASVVTENNSASSESGSSSDHSESTEESNAGGAMMFSNILDALSESSEETATDKPAAEAQTEQVPMKRGLPQLRAAEPVQKDLPTGTGTEVQQVSSDSGFIAAWNNQSVKVIELTGNINVDGQGDSFQTRTSSVTIRSSGSNQYKLNLSGTASTAAGVISGDGSKAATLTLSDTALLGLKNINLTTASRDLGWGNKTANSSKALIIGTNNDTVNTGGAVVVEGKVDITSTAPGSNAAAAIYVGGDVTVNPSATFTLTSASEGIVAKKGNVGVGSGSVTKITSNRSGIDAAAIRTGSGTVTVDGEGVDSNSLPLAAASLTITSAGEGIITGGVDDNGAGITIRDKAIVSVTSNQSSSSGKSAASVHAKGDILVGNNADVRFLSADVGMVSSNGNVTIGSSATVNIGLKNAGDYSNRVSGTGIRSYNNVTVASDAKLEIRAKGAGIENVTGNAPDSTLFIARKAKVSIDTIGDAGEGSSGIRGFRTIAIEDSEVSDLPDGEYNLNIVARANQNNTTSKTGNGIDYTLFNKSNPSENEGLFLGTNTRVKINAQKTGIRNTNGMLGLNMKMAAGSNMKIGTEPGLSGNYKGNTVNGISAFDNITIGDVTGAGAELTVQTNVDGSLTSGTAIEAAGSAKAKLVVNQKSKITATVSEDSNIGGVNTISNFDEFTLHESASAIIKSNQGTTLNNIRGINMKTGSTMNVTSKYGSGIGYTNSNSIMVPDINVDGAGTTLTIDPNKSGILGNSSGQVSVTNGANLKILDAKQNGIEKILNTTFSGSGTMVDIAARDTGVNTGNSLIMTDDASMKITTTTPAGGDSGQLPYQVGDGYGIRNMTTVTLMNTEIVPSPSGEGKLVPGGHNFPNLKRGIDNVADVTLVKNVNIGQVSGSGSSTVHSNGGSAREIPINATGKVTIGDNNVIAGGGYYDAMLAFTARFDGIGIQANEVEITGSDNVIVSNRESTTDYTNTAIKATSSFKITNGNNNNIVGATYGIVNSTGATAVDIKGDKNFIVGISKNGIDTPAVVTSITGNGNTVNGRNNGIISWGGGTNGSEARSITLNGFGNKINATYKWSGTGTDEADGNGKDVGIGINISESRFGTVTITSPTDATGDRNEITGYRFGIKTNRWTSDGHTVTGTLNLGGNTFVSSNKDMTAIAKNVNFTAGNVEMRYWGFNKDQSPSGTEDQVIKSKASVLWPGSDGDTDGQVNVGPDANAFLIGYGYLSSDKNGTDWDNQIPSPIYSAYAGVNIGKDINGDPCNGRLGIRSRGNAINWYRRGSGSSNNNNANNLNRGKTMYNVLAGGRLDLFSDTDNTAVSVVQQLPVEATVSSLKSGGIKVEPEGTFTAYGLNGAGYVFDMPSSGTFEVDNPKLIDFANFAGKRVFSPKTGGTNVPEFYIRNTNISLWRFDSAIKEGVAATDPSGAPKYTGRDEAMKIMNLEDTLANYSYDDVEWLKITSKGSTLETNALGGTRGGKTDQLLRDFGNTGAPPSANENMANISRLRSEVRGKMGIYYQLPEKEPKSFAIQNDNTEKYLFGPELTINEFLSSKRRDIDGNIITEKPLYYGLDEENGYKFIKDVDGIKRLINKFNTSEDTLSDGDALKGYSVDFKGMTWEEDKEKDDTGDPSSPKKDTISPDFYYKLSMPSFESFETSFYASKYKDGTEWKQVSNKPTLLLKRIPFTVDLTIHNTDGSTTTNKTEYSGSYGDKAKDITIGQIGNTAQVKINGGEPIILSGKKVTLPLQYDFKEMTIPEDADEFTKQIWKWQEAAVTDKDPNPSKFGKLTIEITYTDGLQDIYLTAPNLNFGTHFKDDVEDGTQEVFPAKSISEPLSVKDNYLAAQSGWSLQAKITETNSLEDLPGSQIIINGKVLNATGEAENLFNVADYVGGRPSDKTYKLLETTDVNDSDKVHLNVPLVGRTINGKTYHYKIKWSIINGP